MNEIPFSLPLFDQAAQELKEKGSFETELTAQQLKEIMNGVIADLLGGADGVSAEVKKVKVKIADEEGEVSGQVVVESPIQATITIECVLGNAEDDDTRIELVDLDIEQEAGFLARAALSAINIEGKAREALSDPNEILLEALQEQLEPKGIEVSEVSLQFTDRALAIRLS